MSIGTSAKIRIPWGAWDHDQERCFDLGDDWVVDVAAIGEGPCGAGLNEALDTPIGAPTITELALGKSTAAIAVEDITRPVIAGPILEAIIDRLEAGGIPPSRVVVIMALGGHGPMRHDELMHKVGRRVMESCDVVNHHPYENLTDLGRSPSGIPVHVNSLFVKADVKLAVGSILPHPYAGFGGGGKIVLPGIAGIETLEMNHRPAVTGLSGAGLGIVEGNRAREEMEEIALAAGLQAVVAVVPDAKRQPTAHFYGHPVQTHRQAVAHARKVYDVAVRPGADAVLLNSYPKDTELLQVGNAFNAYRTVDPPLVREGGTLIVAASCHHGRGFHSLHGPLMRLYRDPIQRPYVEGRELIVFIPGLSKTDVAKSFWSGYPHAQSWEEVLRLLSERHPSGGRMIVFPTAPLALPRVVGEA